MALAVALVPGPGTAQASAATSLVQFDRAVAYWYLPTDSDDVYRLYHAEIVRVMDLATGEVSATATVVTDRCTEHWASPKQMYLACGDGRREQVTEHADLIVAPDLSSAKATIALGGLKHVIRFAGHESRQGGAFERDRMCPEGQTVIAGAFSNMERARGRLLGKRLRGPYTPGLDHAWIERGYGTWCG